MNNITLDLKEQKILWMALNIIQHQILVSLSKTIEDYRGVDTPMINDWINQTQDEYYVISSLKTKLCGDLE